MALPIGNDKRHGIDSGCITGPNVVGKYSGHINLLHLQNHFTEVVYLKVTCYISQKKMFSLLAEASLDLCMCKLTKETMKACVFITVKNLWA